MTFLVDVNLPGFFSKFQHGDFIFVFNIDQQLADSELWKLALMNDYVILTRDMDFYNRAKESITFPKIIIFRFGNLKLNAMQKYFQENWNSIVDIIKENKLIFAWQHELEIIY